MLRLRCFSKMGITNFKDDFTLKISMISSCFKPNSRVLRYCDCPNLLNSCVPNKDTTSCNSLICTAGNHIVAPIISNHKTSNRSAPLQPRMHWTHENYDRRCIGIRIAEKKPLFVFHLCVFDIFELHIEGKLDSLPCLAQ